MASCTGICMIRCFSCGLMIIPFMAAWICWRCLRASFFLAWRAPIFLASRALRFWSYLAYLLGFLLSTSTPPLPDYPYTFESPVSAKPPVALEAVLPSASYWSERYLCVFLA